jgi:hypothetical protein
MSQRHTHNTRLIPEKSPRRPHEENLHPNILQSLALGPAAVQEEKKTRQEYSQQLELSRVRSYPHAGDRHRATSRRDTHPGTAHTLHRGVKANGGQWPSADLYSTIPAGRPTHRAALGIRQELCGLSIPKWPNHATTSAGRVYQCTKCGIEHAWVLEVGYGGAQIYESLCLSFADSNEVSGCFYRRWTDR